MPTLIIKTNAADAIDNRETVLKQASETLAEALGKPEGYVMVILEPVANMCFGGKTSPCAFLELTSLGLPEARTAELSATLCGFVQEHLSVPQNRVYIAFASPPRHMFGFDGRTF